MPIQLIGQVNDAGRLELELPEALPPRTLVQVTIEPPDQVWYWTPVWQARERQVDEEIAAGQYEDFGTLEGFLDDLEDGHPHI